MMNEDVIVAIIMIAVLGLSIYFIATNKEE